VLAALSTTYSTTARHIIYHTDVPVLSPPIPQVSDCATLASRTYTGTHEQTVTKCAAPHLGLDEELEVPLLGVAAQVEFEIKN
jgi:hypothetical protein